MWIEGGNHWSVLSKWKNRVPWTSMSKAINQLEIGNLHLKRNFWVLLRLQLDPFGEFECSGKNMNQGRDGTPNTVLFTVHQVIADDTSLLKLCEDFLDFLNTKHNNNSSQNWDEKILSNILPLRPALTELLKSHITLSQLDKMLLAFKPIFNRLLKRIVGKPVNPFYRDFKNCGDNYKGLKCFSFTSSRNHGNLSKRNHKYK